MFSNAQTLKHPNSAKSKSLKIPLAQGARLSISDNRWISPSGKTPEGITELFNLLKL